VKSYVFLLAVFLIVPLFALGQTTAPTQNKIVVRVPFVGCESDGQVGPVKAPQGQSKVVTISAEAAQRLAYYKAEYGTGTLAPRGWYCYGTYGSNGSTLYVGPQPINTAELFSTNRKGFTGPAIQISTVSGDTSGRFGVAKMIARVFPAHSDFVEAVIAEGIEPATDFPSGPYPHDKLIYRSKEIVEFETPADTEGLGTDSWLRKNGTPIGGVAILFGEEPNLLHLSVRLPAESNGLNQAIIQQVERDAVRLAKQGDQNQT
jgi:hypothetical protein